jgi:hypothetical protein
MVTQLEELGTVEIESSQYVENLWPAQDMLGIENCQLKVHQRLLSQRRYIYCKTRVSYTHKTNINIRPEK